MPQSSSQPPNERKRRPSSTYLLKAAAAAGLSIRGIEVDPNTGKFTVLVGEPAPLAKAPTEDTNLDRKLED
jgi:hypothetical protein